MGAIAKIEWAGGTKTTAASLVWINSQTAVLGIYQDGDIVIHVESKGPSLRLLQYSRNNMVNIQARDPTNKTKQAFFDNA